MSLFSVVLTKASSFDYLACGNQGYGYALIRLSGKYDFLGEKVFGKD